MVTPQLLHRYIGPSAGVTGLTGCINDPQTGQFAAFAESHSIVPVPFQAGALFLLSATGA